MQPVAIFPRPRRDETPLVHNLFVNQFTTQSTAAVARIAFDLSDENDGRSLIERQAHAAYSKVSETGR